MSLGKSKPCIDLIKQYNKVNKDCLLFYTNVNKFINLNESTILDIGCGNGFYVYGLADKVKFITGLDPSHDMLESAKSYIEYFKKNNIEFLHGSIENNSIDKKYNLILFSYSLHFTKNVYDSLLIAKQYLENNGLIVIIEPTETYHSNKLNKNHKEFDKDYYELKQKYLEISRKEVINFYKLHKLLYLEHNKSYFMCIIMIIN